MENREIDKLIAEKVMGWEQGWNFYNEPCWFDEDNNFKAWLTNDFMPTTKISDAWLVVEKLSSPIIKVLKRFTIVEIHEPYEVFVVKAETAPLAICKAALEAAGVQIEN